VIAPEDVPAPNSLLGALEAMMGSPHLSSRRWIWEQYDHMVMADTVQRPGGDAGVVRVHGTQKGLAISCDVTPRYCAADPYQGAKQAVAECWRNLTATGADPLAITDCMNFATLERPEIMGEFVLAVKGMAEACTAPRLSHRVGNVSLNETNGAPFRQPPPSAASADSRMSPRWRRWREARWRCADLHRPEGSHLGQSLYQESPPPL
jgi:phosphoribosylformylglycinamidine synthase